MEIKTTTCFKALLWQLNKIIHIKLKLSRQELVFNKCQLLLLCNNSYIYTSTMSMQYQNTTDENKISAIHFIPETTLWGTNSQTSMGLKTCNGFLSFKCLKFRIYLFWFRTYELTVYAHQLWPWTRSTCKHAEWSWIPIQKIIFEICTGNKFVAHYLCCTSMANQANVGQQILTPTQNANDLAVSSFCYKH